MLTRKEFYCSVTTRSPFAAVLVRKHFTGKIVVGGAWRSDRSIQAVLDPLKARLQKEFPHDFANAGVTALIEDSEAARGLAELAEHTIALSWSYVYRDMNALRQDLETVLRVEGPHSSKLEIDENGPGAHELAQALDNKVEGGMYDALSLCVFQIKEDESLKDFQEPTIESEFDPFRR